MARNAFRVALRTDTPVPTAGVTQELDPSDILEVQDMAEAIARAEQMVAAPRSSRGGDLAREASASGPSLADMFEALGHRPPAPARATDDAIGPATPAPPPGIPTPVPPRYVTMPSAAPISPAGQAAPTSEDDAYYHPAGRIRSLADVTLDGYRPEATLLVRAAGRRKRFAWLFAAALLPLLVLAAIAVFASSDQGSARAVASIDPARATPSVPVAGKTAMATTSATSKDAPVAPATTEVAAAAASVTGPSLSAGTPPVFDVNSLPSAVTRH